MSSSEPLIFHYTSGNGLIGIIKNRCVWATGSNFMNDPVEVSFAARVLVDELRVQSPPPGTQQRLDEAIALLEKAYIDPNSRDQYREDRLFIGSFSDRDDRLTLWRNYSGPSGACIGFDPSELTGWLIDEYPGGPKPASVEEAERWQGLTDNFHLTARIAPVAYGSGGVPGIARRIVELAESNPPYFESELRTELQSLWLIKHEAFEDEREVRLMVNEVGDFAPNRSVRASARGLAAYHTVFFPHAAVRSITVAPGFNQDQAINAVSSLLQTGGRGAWSHVQLLESDIPYAW